MTRRTIRVSSVLSKSTYEFVDRAVSLRPKPPEIWIIASKVLSIVGHALGGRKGAEERLDSYCMAGILPAGHERGTSKSLRYNEERGL